MKSTKKEIYVTPKLTVHGTVAEITEGCNKTSGTSDGFTYNGQAIVCAS